MNGYPAVVLTDAAGNILAERSFSNDAGLGEAPSHILANADGTYTMLTSGVPTGYIVRKLAADLTPIWEKIITNVTPNGTLQRAADGGYLLTSTNDGSAITGGHQGDTSTDVCVLHLDASGNLTSAFVVGGPAAEGALGIPGLLSTPTVTQTADGGYGLAAASLSYHLPDSIERPDWWVVKTDATGQVPGFPGLMKPVTPIAFFNAHDNTAASTVTNHYAGFPQGYTSAASASTNGEPMFVMQDLGAKTGVNLPTVVFQAAPASGPIAGVIVRVPGNAKPWLAGQPDGTTNAYDIAPRDSPVLVPGLSLGNGAVLTVGTTGPGTSSGQDVPFVLGDGTGNRVSYPAENGSRASRL